MSRAAKHNHGRRRRKVGSKIRRKRWKIKHFGTSRTTKKVSAKTIRKRMKQRKG